jgi:hypothetical protein
MKPAAVIVMPAYNVSAPIKKHLQIYLKTLQMRNETIFRQAVEVLRDSNGNNIS